MDKRLRVVYCIPSVHRMGGMERVLSLKANYFSEIFGYEIHIITTEGASGTTFFYFHPSIQIHDLNIHFDACIPAYKRLFMYIYKRFLYKKRLKQCLHKINPDITIAMQRREIGFISGMMDGSVKIAESHFDKDSFLRINPHLSKFLPQFIWKYWIKNNLKGLGRLSRFVVLTEEDKENWEKWGKKTEVIPDPIAFVPSVFSACTNHDVIAVGRYVPQKGFDMLIAAWRHVVTACPDWKLHIWGEGGQRTQLQIQINMLGLEKSCILEGPTDNVVGKYIENSIFVLSSRFEGFAMVIAEAMACGLPVVAYACPCGPKDLIREGVNGLLVESGNINELSQKIIYMIKHEEERKQMGKNAVKSIERLQIDVVALQWKKLFERLLEESFHSSL